MVMHLQRQLWIAYNNNKTTENYIKTIATTMPIFTPVSHLEPGFDSLLEG